MTFLRGSTAISGMGNKDAVTPGGARKVEGKSRSASQPEVNTILKYITTPTEKKE